MIKNSKWLLLILFYFASSYANTGSDLDLEKKIRKAIETYDVLQTKKLLNEVPDNTTSHIRLRGILFHGLYATDSALVNLKKAQHAFPQDTAILLRLAEVLLWKKDFKNSGIILDAFPFPSSLGYLRVRATQFEISKRFQDALVLWEKVIAKDPEPWGALERKGLVLSWMNRLPESEAVFKSLIVEKKVSKGLRIRALIRLGELLSWQGKQSDAIFQLEQALLLDKENIEANLLKGQALEWSKRYSEAKQHYANLLRRFPNNPECKLRLEKLLWAD